MATDPENAGTVIGEGEYTAGTEVSVETMPNLEYLFLHWIDEDDNVVSSDANFDYVMPSENVTLTAVFDEIVKEGQVYNVDKDKYYNEIQAAIDDAEPGHTMLAGAGMYPERVEVSDLVNIQLIGSVDGDGKPTSIIDHTALEGTGNGIRVTNSANSTIRNFEVTGAKGTSGDNRGWGILVSDSDGAEIENIYSHNNAADGIRVRRSVDATVKNCVSINNSDGITFYAYGQILNNVVGNSTMRGIYVNGEQVGGGKTGTVTISGNEVYNNENAGAIGSSDQRVGGIIVYSAAHVPAVLSVEIEDNIVYENTGPGILLYKVNNEHIDGSSSNPGQAVSSENESIVKGNIIYGNNTRPSMGFGDGILLYMSHYVIIDDNEIYENEEAGIRLTNSYRYNQFGPTTNNKVIGNNIYDNPTALLIQGGTNYQVTDTTVKNNKLLNVGFGLNNLNNGDVIVDATENWWGDGTGPSGGVNDPDTNMTADGHGSEVSEDVRFDPWYVDEEMTTLSD